MVPFAGQCDACGDALLTIGVFEQGMARSITTSTCGVHSSAADGAHALPGKASVAPGILVCSVASL